MFLTRHAASRPPRFMAALIVAALAAWGMVAVSPSASADSDGTLQIEWATPSLLNDVNGNGIPEPGDTVQYTATILSLGPEISDVRLKNSAVNWGPFFAVPTKTFLISLPLVTNAGHYGARGAGPLMDDLTVTYTTPDGDREMTLSAPPAIYAGAPEPEPTPTPTPEPTADPSPEPTADPSPEPEPTWSFDASVEAVTLDGKYHTERPLNQVEVNDVITYKFELTNTGPVTLDYLQLSSWADSAAAPDPRVYTNRSAGIAPGASLPTGTVSPLAVNAMNSAPFMPHWITQEDLDRGYVDLEFEVVAAPAQSDARQQPELATRHFSQRHMLFEGRPTIDLGATVSLSQDANLDGIGQQGERVRVDWYFTNTSSEAVEVVSHTYTWSGGSRTENLVPQVVEPGDTGIGSFWTPVEPADMVAGSAEVSFSVSVRGRESGLTGSAAYGPASVPAGPYVAPEWTWSFSGQTNDVNGDGYLNPGEERTITVWVENRGDKPLVGLSGEEVTGPEYFGPLGLSLPTTVPAHTRIERSVVWTPDESDAGTSWMYGLLMSAEGSGITSRYGTVPVLAYVTPPFTMTTDMAVVDDANADGMPSIGDTVRVSASVTNDGEYLLTGIDAQSAGLSTVPGFTPDLLATLAAGETATDAFDYVLTAADFRRGSASYAFTLGADGQSGSALSPVARLSTIGFAAFEADLDALPGGGLVVCTAGGDVVSEAYPGLAYSIGVGQCGGDAPFQGGTHLVMMSTPVLLATNSVDFTVPADMEAGAHRVALYVDGELFAWVGLEVVRPIAYSGPEGRGDELAFTGTDDSIALAGAWALTLVILGGALVAASHLRRARGAQL